MPITAELAGKSVTLEDHERQRCEIWSRVIGYYRPVEAYNIGKQQEHRDRKFFSRGSTKRILAEAALPQSNSQGIAATGTACMGKGNTHESARDMRPSR